MSFKDFLLKHFEPLQKANIPPLSSISIHSDKVKSSSLFVALKGQKTDGHYYLKQAIQKGAKALLVGKTNGWPPDFKGMILKYKDQKEILPKILNRFYDFPSEKLFTLGVTGSNGKTTFCYLMEWILSSCGWPTAIIGTVEQAFKEHKWPSSLTTPDPVELFGRLNDFVRLEARALAMEVSSHALDQGRVDGLDFNALVFTNLSQDHLDYHKNMDNYFQTKKKLFLPDSGCRGKNLFCLINQDDLYGHKLKPLIKKPLWTYGQNPSSDFSFQIKKITQWNSTFKLKSPFGLHDFFLPLTGLYNVYNAVAGISCALLTGFKAKACAQALKNFPGVPGRMERVQASKPFEVVIDYAHSPSALAYALKALRPGAKKIILVYGCGGDRDKSKRPEMAKIALKLADKVFLTSDNPRHEDPEQIIIDSIKNLSTKERKQITQEPDRKQAIQKAIQSATSGDCVLIAGKGHEDFQIIGDKKIRFCDKEIALECLK